MTPLEMKAEEWKIVEDCQAYMVSNFGQIKRIGKTKGARIGMVLKPYIDNHTGYKKIHLQINDKKLRKYIHDVVLKAFCGERPEGHQCNHKDGNKLNNCIENLEWTTPRANSIHAVKNGLRKYKRKLKTGETWLLKKLTDAGIKKPLVAKMFRVGVVSVYNIAMGR